MNKRVHSTRRLIAYAAAAILVLWTVFSVVHFAGKGGWSPCDEHANDPKCRIIKDIGDEE